MIPAQFEYIKATSVDHAVSLLSEHGYDAKILSGGHSLIPAIKLRLNRPAYLIDIGAISGLNTITEVGDTIVIGGNCTHKQVATSPLVTGHVNVLSQTASVIGDIQVRNRGTIGGSLAHADPASDYPATVLATEAIISAQGPNGTRQIAASDFFEGIFTTSLEDDEIITSISFPKTTNGVYVKFFQSASRFAVVGCAAVKVGSGVRIGITGVSDTPYRASAVESAYDGSDSAASHAVDGVDVMGDHFASEEYRGHLAKVFVGRALMAL
ncbi:MAG: carbon-monoxide dehydrogenase medium subunit [Saprospiraceae bacterium]|jgi:carbon-monoxide dehydrogenase medium subunit